ncbi:MAG TPA: regulatory protein RecX [Gammaproteobacteria bacterium]
MSLSKPKKPEGEDASDPARIRAVALRLLVRREHSSREITAKLTSRGYQHEAVLAVVTALAEENLLSDSRFVEEFVASRARRGSGPVKIREELRGRGVDEALVEATLMEHAETWAANAASVRRKRFGAALPQDYAERARQARFLQQRGFSTEAIRAALKGDIEDE